MQERALSGTLEPMRALSFLWNCVLLVSSASVAAAQLQPPPMARWSEVSVSSRGAVLVGSDGVVLMPRGGAPQRLQKEYEPEVGFARALERGVVFSGHFGLGFLPWEGLDGPVSLARWEREPTEDGEQPSLWMDPLVAREGRVLAVDQERHVWTLDAANTWKRSAKPLPGAVLDIELAGERAVLAAFVTASEIIDGQESPVDEFHCFWSDDGDTWQEATLPPDFDRRNERSWQVVADGALWVIDLGDAQLLTSRDGKSWSRETMPATDGVLRGRTAVANGKLHVLDSVQAKPQILHVRQPDATWQSRALPAESDGRFLVPAQDRLLVFGSRDAAEVPNLMPLETFLEPRERPTLPECTSFRYSLPDAQPFALGVLRDRVVAYSQSRFSAETMLLGLKDGAWEPVYSQQDPDIYLAKRDTPQPSGPVRSRCGAGVCVTIDENGRYERTVDDRFREAWQLDEARRLVTLAYGAGQWAALDVEGRLLLSRDALEWRYALPDSLRFVQLAGSSSELVATTSESQVLSWRCAPDFLASAPVLDVRSSGSSDAVAASSAASTPSGLGRAQDTQQAYIADVTPSDLFDDADYDGTTLALRSGTDLYLTQDAVKFQRVAIPDAVPALRTRLASHARRLWSTEWNDLSTDAVRDVRSTVRWFSSAGVAQGARRIPNGVLLDSASDGERVAFLSSDWGTGYSQGRLHWTPDGGATWRDGVLPVWVQPSWYDGSVYKSLGAFACGNGAWVVLGYAQGPERERAAVAISRDLVTWTTHLLPDMVEAPYALAFAQQRFLALAPTHDKAGTDLLSSTNGVDWKVERFSSLPRLQLGIGRTRTYLHTHSLALTQNEQGGWRELVTPDSELRWMTEDNGTLFYLSEGGLSRSRNGNHLILLRTPAPSAAVLTRNPAYFAFQPQSADKALENLRNQLAGTARERGAYQRIDEHIAEQRFISEEHARKLVLTVFEKRRTPNMFFRLAEVVSSPTVNKVAKELLTATEQSLLRDYAQAAKQCSGHLAERLYLATPTPESAPIDSPGQPPFDISGAWKRYEEGSVGAAFDLAVIYARGNGVEQDMNRAMQLRERVVARLGEDPEPDRLAAAGSIIGLLDSGLADYEALRFAASAEKLRKAADLNSWQAQYIMARECLMNGSMTFGTIDQAYLWLLHSARHGGYGDSMNLLGIAISEGIGTDANESIAERWYELGATYGSPEAATNLKNLRERRATWGAMTESLQQSNAAMNRMTDAMGFHTDLLNSALEDTEPAEAPKYRVGSVIGTFTAEGFQPAYVVHYARADGDYRVFVRSQRTWPDTSTNPPTERTVSNWTMKLACITELDNFMFTDTSLRRCPDCDLSCTVLDDQKVERVCGRCAGRGLASRY